MLGGLAPGRAPRWLLRVSTNTVQYCSVEDLSTARSSCIEFVGAGSARVLGAVANLRFSNSAILALVGYALGKPDPSYCFGRSIRTPVLQIEPQSVARINLPRLRHVVIERQLIGCRQS